MLPIFLNNQTQSSLVLRIVRIIRVILHTLYGIFVSVIILPTLNRRQRNRLVGHWSHQLLRIFNIQLVVNGEAPNRDLAGIMFVGNHISWLDIHVLNSIHTVRFIAKSEVKNWPVFGWLAKKANTLFINREDKKDTVRVIESTSKGLLKGDSFCFFPEGTTTDGTDLLRFKGSLMQASINSNADIWPFVISYPDHSGSPNKKMAFVGKTTLLESIWQIICISCPQANITFLPKVSSKGHERRGLTILVRNEIASYINETYGHHL